MKIGVQFSTDDFNIEFSWNLIKVFHAKFTGYKGSAADDQKTKICLLPEAAFELHIRTE